MNRKYLLPALAVASPAQAACGSSVVKVASPNPGSAYNGLFAVDASSSSNVWAGGEYRDGPTKDHVLIERLSGGHWKVVPAPNPTNSSSPQFHMPWFAGQPPNRPGSR